MALHAIPLGDLEAQTLNEETLKKIDLLLRSILLALGVSLGYTLKEILNVTLKLSWFFTEQ